MIFFGKQCFHIIADVSIIIDNQNCRAIRISRFFLTHRKIGFD